MGIKTPRPKDSRIKRARGIAGPKKDDALVLMKLVYLFQEGVDDLPAVVAVILIAAVARTGSIKLIDEENAGTR